MLTAVWETHLWPRFGFVWYGCMHICTLNDIMCSFLNAATATAACAAGAAAADAAAAADDDGNDDAVLILGFTFECYLCLPFPSAGRVSDAQPDRVPRV